MSDIVVPQYPDVPVAPGVPPLPRKPGATPAASPSLQSDDASASQQQATPQWGIYTSGGAPLVTGDSVVGFEYKGEFRVSDYPLEGGNFESYNKVATPFDIRMVFTKGGTDADRAAFLTELQSLLDSVEIVSAVTPEMPYPSVTVDHIDYRRDAKNGVTLLTVAVWLVEVRTVAAGTFSNTRQPSGADPVNDGPVQPSAPPTGASTSEIG